MKCHEIVHYPDGSHGVCEATRFTEHTHCDPMPYMRPLRDGELLVELDDNLYLADGTRGAVSVKRQGG